MPPTLHFTNVNIDPPSASEVSAEAAAGGGGALGSARLRDFKLSKREMLCFETRIQTYGTY
jgi:hypothetical protein